MTARIEHLSPETVVVAKGLVAGTVNLALGMAFAEGATAALTFGPIALALLVGGLGYGCRQQSPATHSTGGSRLKRRPRRW